MHGASQVSEWDGRAWREVGLLRRARLSAKPSLSPVSPRSTWVNIDAHTWILWTRDALELVVVVASFVVSLQYSVDELLKGFICSFEERWEAKEQDSDQQGQRRHAFAFPKWKFFTFGAFATKHTGNLERWSSCRSCAEEFLLLRAHPRYLTCSLLGTQAGALRAILHVPR